MKEQFERILKKYSTKDLVYYDNCNANTIYYQLLGENSKNEEKLIKITDELIPLNLVVDDWMLYMLSKYLCIDTIEHLHKKGFDLNSTDTDGENILFKFFEQTCFNFSEESFIFLKSVFERMLKLGINYTLVNSHGRSLIHHSVASGVDATFLEYIISLNLDINKQDNDGFTPLHFEVLNCSFYSLEKIQLLLNNGASHSKYIKTFSHNYDTTDTPLPSGLTPLEIFEYQNKMAGFDPSYIQELIEILK